MLSAYTRPHKACKAFVNMNAVTGTSSAKTPELLAKFSDLILKKGSKVAIEEDIMGDVRDVVSMATQMRVTLF